jgi:hypothetical protein
LIADAALGRLISGPVAAPDDDPRFTPSRSLAEDVAPRSMMA